MFFLAALLVMTFAPPLPKSAPRPPCNIPPCTGGPISEKGIAEHMRETHMTKGASGDPKYECPDCKNKYKREKDLRNHYLKHHNPGTQSFEEQYRGPSGPCPDCNKFFATKSNLTRHRKIHTKETTTGNPAPPPSGTTISSLISEGGIPQTLETHSEHGGDSLMPANEMRGSGSEFLGTIFQAGEVQNSTTSVGRSDTAFRNRTENSPVESGSFPVSLSQMGGSGDAATSAIETSQKLVKGFIFPYAREMHDTASSKPQGGVVAPPEVAQSSLRGNARPAKTDALVSGQALVPNGASMNEMDYSGEPLMEYTPMDNDQLGVIFGEPWLSGLDNII